MPTMIVEPLRDRTEALLGHLLQREETGDAVPQSVLLARELLVLLRDPSASMIKAGVRTVTGLQPTPEAMAQTMWQRMIDAALDEMK